MARRVGIFGNEEDRQVQRVSQELQALGAEPLLISPSALARGLPLSERDGRFIYRGVDTSELTGFYLRGIPAAYAPAFEKDEELVLYEDWFIRYMQERERASFYIAWLLSLQERGVRLVNGPQAASVLQYKPFQLHALRTVGAQVPKTLLSNDPEAVRAFRAEVGEVIYKPLMGGALTQPLDDARMKDLSAVTLSPVIFQERVDGDDLRVMLAGDDIVSSVAIRTPAQHLDFRGDPTYASGAATYEEVTLPAEVAELCRRAARLCGLLFAGIDIKRTSDGRWVFLELNSSPIYLDVEWKLGHPISRAIAELVLGSRNPA